MNKEYYVYGAYGLHGNLSQQESLGIEKNLIETHKPKFNTRYAKPKQDYIGMKKLFIEWLDSGY